MQIRNNRGELVGEINVIIRPGEGVITTNTVYSGAGVDQGIPSPRAPVRRIPESTTW